MSFVCGLSQSCLRPPPPWTGYAGRDSETESAHPSKVRERRSATVDCLRLVCCIGLQTQQGRSSSETLQRSHFFACTAKKTKLESDLCVFHKFGCNVLRALTRSSSAYVPSARQAGPHAHSL